MSVNDPKTWQAGDILSIKYRGATITGPIEASDEPGDFFLAGLWVSSKHHPMLGDVEYLSWERPKPELTWGAVIQNQDMSGNVERLFYLPDSEQDTLPFTTGRGGIWYGWNYLGPDWEVLLEGV